MEPSEDTAYQLPEENPDYEPELEAEQESGEFDSEEPESIDIEARLTDPTNLRAIVSSEAIYKPLAEPGEVETLVLQNNKPVPSTMMSLLFMEEKVKSNWPEAAKKFEGDETLCRYVLGYLNANVQVSENMTSIARALALLTTYRVLDTALQIGFVLWAEKYRINRAEKLNARHFLRHVLLTANIAKLLAEEMPGLDFEPDRAFAGALLQKVGIMALQYRLPSLYKAILLRQQDTGKPLHEIERFVIQTDHGEIGGSLLQSWGFAEDIADCAGKHLSKDPDSQFGDLTQLCKLATYIASSRGVGVVRNQKVEELEMGVKDMLRRVKPAWARGEPLGPIMLQHGERIQLRNRTVSEILNYIEQMGDMRFVDSDQEQGADSSENILTSMTKVEMDDVPALNLPELQPRKVVRTRRIFRPTVWDYIVPGLGQMRFGSYHMGRAQLGCFLAFLFGTLGSFAVSLTLTILFVFGMLAMAIWSMASFPNLSK